MRSASRSAEWRRHVGTRPGPAKRLPLLPMRPKTAAAMSSYGSPHCARGSPPGRPGCLWRPPPRGRSLALPSRGPSGCMDAAGESGLLACYGAFSTWARLRSGSHGA
eukprot:2914231-Alexandrium_andersonii.AAC.1